MEWIDFHFVYQFFNISPIKCLYETPFLTIVVQSNVPLNWFLWVNDDAFVIVLLSIKV